MTSLHDVAPLENSLEFIGTATVLIRFAGFTILTDPNFLHAGDHVHLGYGLRAKRLTEPSRELSSLPKLDCVILSHMHEDHFDRGVQRELDKSVPIVTTPQAAGALHALGFQVIYPLETWTTIRLAKGPASLRISAMPGTHGPGPLAFALPAVMGSMLDFETGNGERLRLYISGDTLLHERLAEIPKRFPSIDIALLHLGGTRVLGVMVTMDGAQGVRLLQLVAPRIAVPIHYDDYDRFRSPLSDFEREVERAGLTGSVRYLARGETLALAARPAL